MKKSCFWVAIAATCASPTAAQWSLDTVLLVEEAVITAQPCPTPAQQATHSIKVIDRQTIERLAAVNLADVLAQQLNIRLSQDNILGSGTEMQGLSGENVKILIDGVPIIGRQNGNIDLRQINLHNVERIEVVESPLSVQYGSNAIAGTINIITRRAPRATYEAGTTGYMDNAGNYNLSATAGWRAGKGHQLLLNGGRNFFDGWKVGDGFWADLKRPVADTTRYKTWKPKEQAFAQLTYAFTREKWGLRLQSGYFGERITNRGMPRAPYMETAIDDYYRSHRIDNSISFNTLWSDAHRFQLIAAYNHYQRRKNTFFKDLTTLEQAPSANAADHDTTVFRAAMLRAVYNLAPDSAWWAVEAGLDLNHEVGTGLRLQNGQKDMGDYALFATTLFKPVKTLDIRLGLRYSYNTAYRSPLIPSLSLRYTAGNFTLRASYTRGFRAPSLKELYFYFVDINHNIVGNPHLKAENSNHFVFNGLHIYKTSKIKLQTQIGAYYNALHNLITLAQSSPISNQFAYVNIGRFSTWGCKAEFQLLYRSLQISAGGLLGGRYNSLKEPDNALPAFTYSPEISASLQYEWEKIGFTAAFFYKYQGCLSGFAFDEQGNIQPTRIADYHWADLCLTQTFWHKRIKLSAGLKNIFGVTNVYANLAGGAHSGGGSGSAAVGTGRVFFLKLEFSYAHDK